MTEENVLRELHNIVTNAPLFAGDTISHRTANECVRRGWARRNENQRFVPTHRGMRMLKPRFMRQTEVES